MGNAPNVVLEDVTLVNGSAPNGGGAMYVRGDSVTTTVVVNGSSHVSHNEASGDCGGAIEVSLGALYLEGCHFEGNRALEHGAAVCATNSATNVDATDCTFANNYRASGQTKHGGIELR